MLGSLHADVYYNAVRALHLIDGFFKDLMLCISVRYALGAYGTMPLWQTAGSVGNEIPFPMGNIMANSFVSGANAGLKIGARWS